MVRSLHEAEVRRPVEGMMAADRDWLYVFKPKVAATVLYLKVAIRQDCIVVSLHEDEENGND